MGSRRPGADPRARLPAASPGPPQVLLEEREVARGDRGDGRGPPRLLGAERLQQLRRSLARGALLVAAHGVAAGSRRWGGAGGRVSENLNRGWLTWRSQREIQGFPAPW